MHSDWSKLFTWSLGSPEPEATNLHQQCHSLPFVCSLCFGIKVAHTECKIMLRSERKITLKLESTQNGKPTAWCSFSTLDGRPAQACKQQQQSFQVSIYLLCLLWPTTGSNEIKLLDFVTSLKCVSQKCSRNWHIQEIEPCPIRMKGFFKGGLLC